MGGEAPKPTLSKEGEVWVVRVEGEGGQLHEYRCATEAQARQLLEALTARPLETFN